VGIRINSASADGGAHMTWSKPEFEIVELGMEVGAYAGNA
jgi:coenzyme PQQ precursor peptide PqqA